MLTINDLVKYTNGNPTVCTGKIVRCEVPNYYTVIDPNDEAEVILWNAGYAVGSFIHISQIIN